MSVATVEVDVAALLHNVNCFKRQAPHSQIWAIIKANAYGHGKTEVARFLQKQVDGFGVARLSEALELRSVGIIAPILLLEGFFPDEDITLLERYSLQTMIHSPEQIERLRELKTSYPLNVWFKLDSGMHRLGFRPEQARHYFNLLAACPSVAKPINIASHFCCADELDNPYTTAQIQVFDDFIAAIDDPALVGLQSLCASSGLFGWQTAHRDIVRPGLVLYGISPFDYQIKDKATGAALGLLPVMTLKSMLIAVRDHKQGEGVGYGQTWRSPRDTRLGVIAMGYGDGYPRGVPADIPVMINGQLLPIVGRIAMDMIVVDLGPDTSAQIGDEVIFWGPDLPVEKIAALSGMSAYELVVHLTSRAKLVYKF
ncbi:alanine racemase [Utexia brackfieldae]|uniref:alanine racemase n=1 Tax=Utexia brackfieldae TaxID=3074108 RepID=UPI00370D49B9